MPWASPRVVRRLLGAALLIAVAVGAGCRSEPERPNVLLITVDSLRWDRLGYAGLDRPVSPEIDRLAASGVVFEQAFSQAGWTLPSIATVLTGRYPSEHGAIQTDRAVAGSIDTLAELLGDLGYETRAHVSHVMLRPRSGLARGFDVYDDSVLEVGRPHKVATARQLTDRALAGLDEASEPFLMWVHYFDPHFAYLAHPEWVEFGGGDLDRYDGEVAHTDREIGRLLAGLGERGLTGRTAVILTSDHGEEFGEHGGRLHFSLHAEVTRVPLIVRVPGAPPFRDRKPAEQIDLVPTILTLTGGEIPDDLPGGDLLAPTRVPRPIFMERNRPSQFVQRVVIAGRFKLYEVSSVARGPSDGGASPQVRPGVGIEPGLYLYDLQADPGETTNLWHEEHPAGRELRERLRRGFGTAAGASEEVPVDEDLRRKLESLGYTD